ncbi:uncharacterized protein LOC133311237 [Gastrolobium bilobum]|uniref:uncharacterized protein LOC133311237 n=1 Tax=Gastrolobium bilobum TaxID=150636 RepID=UPI002AB28902|nr:uncharacterized protein LOC133311237 [Gastrolobium bilobum]
MLVLIVDSDEEDPTEEIVWNASIKVQEVQDVALHSLFGDTNTRALRFNAQVASEYLMTLNEYYRRKHKDQAASNSGPKSNTGNSKGKGLQVKQSDGKFKKIGNSNQGNFKSVPQCAICGRAHTGVCRKEKGLCYKCGQPGHFIKDCPFSGGQVSAIQATPAPMMIEEPSLPLPPPTARVYAVTQPEAEKSSTLVRGMISIKDELLSVLFDSGATHSFIADYVADAFGLPLTIMKTPMRIVTAVGNVFNEKYICEDVKFKYEGKEYSADFFVLHLASVIVDKS